MRAGQLKDNKKQTKKTSTITTCSRFLIGRTCPERLGLDAKVHLDAVLRLVLFELLHHGLGPVVNSQHNVLDTGGRQGGDLVLDHGLVGKRDERLGQAQRERPQARAKACGGGE